MYWLAFCEVFTVISLVIIASGLIFLIINGLVKFINWLLELKEDCNHNIYRIDCVKRELSYWSDKIVDLQKKCRKKSK